MSFEKQRNKRLNRGKTSKGSARVLPPESKKPASPVLGSEANLWALAQELGADHPACVPTVALSAKKLEPTASGEEARTAGHPLGPPKAEEDDGKTSRRSRRALPRCNSGRCIPQSPDLSIPSCLAAFLAKDPYPGASAFTNAASLNQNCDGAAEPPLGSPKAEEKDGKTSQRSQEALQRSNSGRSIPQSPDVSIPSCLAAFLAKDPYPGSSAFTNAASLNQNCDGAAPTAQARLSAEEDGHVDSAPGTALPDLAAALPDLAPPANGRSQSLPGVAKASLSSRQSAPDGDAELQRGASLLRESSRRGSFPQMERLGAQEGLSLRSVGLIRTAHSSDILPGQKPSGRTDTQGDEGTKQIRGAAMLEMDPLDTLDLITTQAHLFGADPSSAQAPSGGEGRSREDSAENASACRDKEVLRNEGRSGDAVVSGSSRKKESITRKKDRLRLSESPVENPARTENKQKRARVSPEGAGTPSGTRRASEPVRGRKSGPTVQELREQLGRAEDELRSLREAVTCRKCLERPRNTLLFPCLHLLYCDTCLKDCTACPFCKAPTAGHGRNTQRPRSKSVMRLWEGGTCCTEPYCTAFGLPPKPMCLPRSGTAAFR